MILSTPSAFALVALSPLFRNGADGAVEDVLSRTRSALGLDPATALALAGEAEFRGAVARFRIDFSADGRFVRTIDGPLGEASGFDGTTAWSTDAGGLASAIELEDEEVQRLGAGFVGGDLFRGASGASQTLRADPGKGEIAIDVRLPGGLRTGRVDVDAATAVPLRLSIPTVFRAETWTLGDWRSVGSRRVPYRIERRTTAGTADTFRVAEARAVTGPEPSYGLPSEGRGLGRFDAAIAPEIEVRRAPTGHLLVHPRLEGKDVGWFILDSGAGVPVVTAAAADSAGLEALGRTFVGGAGEERPIARQRLGTRFDLGPLTIAPIVYVELDLSSIGGALGTPVAGVIGFELFRRAVVAVDMTAPRVAIHDPATFRRGGLEWRPLVLHERHPHVRARYEGVHEGLFRIDTGAGSAAVVFHSPAVAKRNLLQNRNVSDVTLGGAGGLSRALWGPVRDFEIGGRKLDSVTAIFPKEGSGALDDPYSEGTIGGGVVGGFEMIFDYGRRRIAFAPR